MLDRPANLVCGMGLWNNLGHIMMSQEKRMPVPGKSEVEKGS